MSSLLSVHGRKLRHVGSGRVVSNFICNALKGEDLVIFGDGKQSRSLQYVHDLIDGMILLVGQTLFGSLGIVLTGKTADEFGRTQLHRVTYEHWQ